MGIEGKIVVFTGKISQPRHEFEKLVRDSGGIFGMSVTRSTDYLVVGEKPGSKLGVAALLGTRILTEQELLAMLVPASEEEDKPMTREAYEALTVLLKCRWCGRSYRQWLNLKVKDTCPVCEFRAKVSCPHCTNDNVLYVEDYKMYSCNCGQWFEAPYSTKVKSIKHLHMWVTATQVGNIVHKRCVCGYRVQVPAEDTLISEHNYQMYPTWVPQWRKEHQEREERRKADIRTEEWFNSLSQEKKEEVIRQVHQIQAKNKET